MMVGFSFFKANVLPRTRSLFLPSGSSDNPTPTAPKARVVRMGGGWVDGRQFGSFNFLQFQIC